MTHLDPRAPLVVDTRDLPRRPGSMRTVSRTVAAPAGFSGELVGVAEGSDLALDLRLESVSEGVLVSGTVSVMLTGECARCLDPLTSKLEVDVMQLFVYPGRELESDADDDEIGLLVDDYLDLEPVLRDAVVLALPLAPVCREDCPGLCPECGVQLASVGPDHRHDEVDPRWVALRQLSGTEGSNTSISNTSISNTNTSDTNISSAHDSTINEQES
ncbi:MAG: YceD family protein [Gaiellaceae bacterium]